MAEVTTSPVTTFDVQNYVGQLFRVTPEDAPLTTMIGGLGAGSAVYSREFTWQTEDNDAAAQTAALEGVDPTYTARDRSPVVQVVQIFQYGVNIAYSKMMAVDQLASDAANILGLQPVQDEVAHQLGLKLARAKRDLEYSVLRGIYNNPSANSSARKMRGLENAIVTNDIDASDLVGDATFDFTGGTVEDEWTVAAGHGLVTGDEVQFTAVGTGATGASVNTPYWVIRVNSTEFQLATSLDNALAGTQLEGTADSAGTWTLRKSNRLSKSLVNKLIRSMAGETDTGGAPFGMPLFIGNAYNKQRVTELFGYAPDDRNIGGLNIKNLELDIVGNVGVIWDRYMPKDKLFLVDMSLLKLRFAPIKNRGVFFLEPRADTGSSEHWQLYGEIGFEYGPEEHHGMVSGLTTDEQAT